MRSTFRARVAAAALVISGLAISERADAQRPKPAPKPPAPVPEKPATAPAAPTEEPLRDMLATTNGGLTSEQAGTRAMSTSFNSLAAAENAAAAAARSETALVGYVPRVTFTGRYTRLSEYTPPQSGGNGSFVVTDSPPGTANPPTTRAAPATAAFPIILNQWLLQAAVVVPISDYFLKIGPTYKSATEQEEAAQLDYLAARAKAYSDGKQSYFLWLRARGALNVAQQTLAVAKAHEKDSELLFVNGSSSKADVLRAQTQVAAAELAVEQAKNLVKLTEIQLRVAMHSAPNEKLDPGESLSTDAASNLDLASLTATARANRPEIKSIDKNAEAFRKQASAQRATRYPALSAFGDVTYANPNPRRFPQEAIWFPTWSVGAQLVWSPSDLFAGGTGARDLEARAAALEAQKKAIRDVVDVEVTQAYQSVLEADFAVITTARQLESATENYRVARELFNGGRATATQLIDAETTLAQSRFDNLNAKVETKLARVRLDHAIGKDLTVASKP